MKRGDVVTVAASGDYGKPRPAVIVQTNALPAAHASVIVCRPPWRQSDDAAHGAGVRQRLTEAAARTGSGRSPEAAVLQATPRAQAAVGASNACIRRAGDASIAFIEIGGRPWRN
ncbi:MAG: type II toxin-antitoxin system PemK/MazF family toxin [Proteobacteria bacterium]|nr:type II toxin-antitoxin system PemK/MazF family toxin [Pseudomonadota bacterium]